MARRRVRLNKIKDIIRFRLGAGMGERKVARAIGVSRTAVSNYVTAFRASGLELSQLESMADSALTKALQGVKPPAGSTRYRELSERFPAMVVELKKKGMTLQLLWERYLCEFAQGYQYSQFCLHFHRWCDVPEIGMHIEHKAGEEMFADWAGDKLVVENATTGHEWALDLFVAILGASELTYVEARESQKEEDWIRGNEGALRYFEGSPMAIIPDNPKTAVIKVDPYEPGINPVFDAFASHYGLVIMPARARKPRDKALVENAVRLVYQRISIHLSGKRFFCLREVNQEVRELLEKHNSRRFQRLPYSRRELFEQIERKALRPLPAENFPLKDIELSNVQFNYHVELRHDRHYYSVPYYLYRREEKTQVKLVYDERVVAIYYDNQRIAQHRRDLTPNGYTTLPEHMTPEHRWYAGWSRERFMGWARSMGGEVEEVIGKVLDSRPYAPQAFRTCLGILNLHKTYGQEKLAKACRRALSFGSCSYTRISNILAQGLEEERQPQLALRAPCLPEHENVRGSGYFN
jgi:transposase